MEDNSPQSPGTGSDSSSLETSFLALLKELEGRTTPMMDDLVRNELFLKLAGGVWNTLFSLKGSLDEIGDKRNELLNLAGKTSQDRILHELRRLDLRLARVEELLRDARPKSVREGDGRVST